MSEVIEKFQRALREWEKDLPIGAHEATQQYWDRIPVNSGVVTKDTCILYGDLRALLGEIERIESRAAANVTGESLIDHVRDIEKVVNRMAVRRHASPNEMYSLVDKLIRLTRAREKALGQEQRKERG